MSADSGPSFKTNLIVLISLLIFTVITVAAAQIDFGAFNVLIAMLIAVIKGALVLMYFMHLKYDEKLYALIFGSAVFFVFLLYFFSKLDLATRVMQESVL